MHWIFWAVLACLVFLATYNPRTGNLNKFLDFSQKETEKPTLSNADASATGE
jgi:hypothetical protein